MFSDFYERFALPPNALYRERDALKKSGHRIIDLVSGNVNEQGIHYPKAALEAAFRLGLKKATVYRPDPLGQLAARQAVSRFYQEEELPVPADQIVITPGTSLSYSYLFRLLGRAGDEFLCPRPSYPLFDSIAAFCGVRLASYPLKPEKRWTIDFAALEATITPKTRAIILISPNNPTGAVATQEEVNELAAVARRHQLPIISDEVFSPFLLASPGLPPPRLHLRGLRSSREVVERGPSPLGRGAEGEAFPRPATASAPLVFTLNGFSKMFALPGMKIGWIAVSGEKQWVDKAMQTLSHLSDTFLPVNEAAQFAVPLIFKNGKAFLKGYQAEICRRATSAMKILAQSPQFSFLPPEGGFYLTLRLKDSNLDDEEVTLDLLRKEHLLVHPGYFYELPSNHLVLSFISRPAVLRMSLRRMARF